MENSSNELTGRKEPKKKKRPLSSLRDALVEAGEAPNDSDGKTSAMELAEVAWKRAIAGNLEWAHWIRDTVLGKPSQGLTLDTDGSGGPLTVVLQNFAAENLQVNNGDKPKAIEKEPAKENESEPTGLGDLA